MGAGDEGEGDAGGDDGTTGAGVVGVDEVVVVLGDAGVDGRFTTAMPPCTSITGNAPKRPSPPFPSASSSDNRRGADPPMITAASAYMILYSP